MNKVIYCAIFCVLIQRSSGVFNNIFRKVEKKLEKDTNFDCEENKLVPRITSAIVGGRAVRNSLSAAYVAAIGDVLSNGTVQWYCGGSFISPTLVLTAAHCSARQADVVRGGTTSLNSHLSPNDIAIASFVSHPKHRRPQSYHDIAVVRLASSAENVPGVKPICLGAAQGDLHGQNAFVLGWGAETFGGDGSADLRQVDVKVFSNEACDAAYRNSSAASQIFPTGVARGQICAGSADGGKDSCQGDSGGPLVWSDSNGVLRLIGVVSLGRGCGFKEFPGVYARTSEYKEWIMGFVS